MHRKSLAATIASILLVTTLGLASNEANARADETKAGAKPKRTMLVRVLGPDGDAVEGATLRIAVWSTPRFAGKRDYVCDDEGQALVALPEKIDILRIWARKPGHVPLFAQWWPKKQPDGHLIPKEYTFRLPKGTEIGGVVRNAKGEPIKGAKVEVQHVEQGPYQERVKKRPRLGTWLAYGSAARITDAGGRWSLNNVPAGDVDLKLMLSHPDYVGDQSWGGLQAKQKVTLKALRAKTAAIVMQRGVRVTGKVVDGEGKPVPDAVVIWGDDPYGDTGSQEVKTDVKGMYRFPPLAAGPLTVTVVARGWAPELKKIEIAADKSRVDFNLKAGKTLKIQFVDRAGAPIPDVSVSIHRWRGGKSMYNNRHPNVLDTQIPVKSDDKGRFLWTWAPGDPVEYNFYSKLRGFVRARAITADGSTHTVKIPR